MSSSSISYVQRLPTTKPYPMYVELTPRLEEGLESFLSSSQGSMTGFLSAERPILPEPGDRLVEKEDFGLEEVARGSELPRPQDP